MTPQTASAILGVGPESTREDVLRSYRKLAKKHHPDVGGDADEFRRLTEAKDALLSPSPRTIMNDLRAGAFSPRGYARRQWGGFGAARWHAVQFGEWQDAWTVTDEDGFEHLVRMCEVSGPIQGSLFVTQLPSGRWRYFWIATSSGDERASNRTFATEAQAMEEGQDAVRKRAARGS